MILKLYDIGRADCMLLYTPSFDKANKLLMIDCGVAKYDVKNLNEINLDLKSSNENNLLISHFHRDHIRGLYYIDKYKFDKIYLNYYLKCAFSSYDINTLTKILRIYYLSNPGTLLKNRFHFILNHLYICSVNLKPHGAIKFINAGDKFNVIDDYFMIWPNIICNIKNIESHAKMMLSIDEYIEENQFIKENKNLDKFMSSYIDIYENIKSYYKENIIWNQNIMEAGSKINDLLESIDKLWDKTQEVSEQYTISKSVSSYFNEISTVIHNDKGLYMGDVESAVVRKLKSQYNSNYTVVKTPHHGSNSHFDISIPSNHIFVSCSNSKRDINSKNSYFTHFPKTTHIFSNGTAYISGKIMPGFHSVNVKIPL